MVKKEKKGKARKDIHYRMAKESGYRSRACFKLIQINKKYNFLEKANAVIDLCAAPGGWLQVVSKFSPITCKKIGLDLVPIKPIPGVKTFVQDITTPQCYQLLKKELNGIKADCVLNDGAPNVGSNWSKDAFSQTELTLCALKLACNFLRPGGVFVTKVFRSKDYNALIWVCKKFFKNVEANKPKASRFQSAEIFLVCSDFIAPDFIDDKLFETKYIFKDTEDDYYTSQVEHEVNSIDKIMQKRRKRVGYADDVKQTVFQAIPFSDFIKSNNPYAVFLTHNAISFKDPKDLELLEVVKAPEDWKELCEDILVLGKRDIAKIIKWRNKIIHTQKKLKQKQKKENKDMQIEEEDDDDVIENDLEDNEDDQNSDNEEENEDDNEEENEDDNDEEIEEEDNEEDEEDESEENEEQKQEEQDSESELEKELQDLQKKELNKQRKLKAKQAKIIQKQAVTSGFANNFEDEELFADISHKDLMKLGYEDLSDEENKHKMKKLPNKISFKNNKELEQNLEGIYEAKKLKQAAIKAKAQAKNKEQDIDLSENKLQVKPLNQQEHQQVTKIIKKRKFFDNDLLEDELTSENSQSENEIKGELYYQDKKNTFVNPLKKSHLAGNDKNKDSSDDEEHEIQNDDLSQQDDDKYVDLNDDNIYIKKRRHNEAFGNDDYIDPNEKFPGELSDDDAYIIKVPKSDMEKRRRALKRADKKKKLKNNEGAASNAEQIDNKIEIVPQLEDYDIDSLAETLALAKKMQRKRARENIIDSTYSRFAFEDQEDLPAWFKEDEDKHNYKHLPITKEELQAEKEKIMAINRRAPKKILEAKIRNFKRTEKKMKKAQKKASMLMEQEGISEQMKLRQVKQLYNKEKRGLKQEKKYVVSKKGESNGSGKNSRFTKFVDKRLKKDTKAQKKAFQKGGSTKRQQKRHKGKKHKY